MLRFPLSAIDALINRFFCTDRQHVPGGRGGEDCMERPEEETEEATPPKHRKDGE